eukprot:gene9874-11588_t
MNSFMLFILWLCFIALAKFGVVAETDVEEHVHRRLSVQSYTFDVGKHEFTVPEGVTTLSVILSGASGGNAYNTNNGILAKGGLGGIIAAEIHVQPGETLVIYVGGAGTENGEGGYNGEDGKQGYYASGNLAGGGGRQDTGGQPGYYCTVGGDFGQGAACCEYAGAGGGGGYYGGGGAHMAAGGGGSNFAADGYKSSGVAFPAGNGTATLTWFPATALSVEFNDKGHHEFTVPIGVTTLSVLLSGASGGSSFSTDYARMASGGRGGLIRADILVEPGEILRIFVGGAGSDSAEEGGGDGGFNGEEGGLGDVINITPYYPGGGGTSSRGGHPGFNCNGGYLGEGAACCTYYGAGGGGGYYGGGGAHEGSGGGGSSYAAEGYISSGVAFPAGDGRATLSWTPSAIQSVTFNNAGMYEFSVPDTVTTLFAILSGASGGSSINTYSQIMVPGGFGGLISAEIQVLPTETLRIFVGGAGSENGIGGFNGGGNSCYDPDGSMGDGTSYYTAGGGGSQSAGGSANPNYDCNTGEQGYGANCCGYYGAGGGGGYFGGGGAHGAAGGGGSSYAMEGSYISSGIAYPAGNGSVTLFWIPSSEMSVVFTNTGDHEFIVPEGVTTLSVTLYGASGGDSFNSGYRVTAHGGKGGMIVANIAVQPGENLRVFVGGAGIEEGSGGFNGGGDSCYEQGTPGGSAGWPQGQEGGRGDGTHYSVSSWVPGGGGTQNDGGHPGSNCNGGDFGQGAACCNYYGAGGGGGYFGGGGSYGAAGGGGSSYAIEGFVSSGIAYPVGNGKALLSWMFAPSASPTAAPTVPPTSPPVITPTKQPTALPTANPSNSPTINPTVLPTLTPSVTPTVAPSCTPSCAPSRDPTVLPTLTPSFAPSAAPTLAPTVNPSNSPTVAPTCNPS